MIPVLTGAFIFAAYIALISNAPVAMAAVFGVVPEAVGGLLAIIASVNVCGVLLARRLLNTSSPRAIIRGATGVACIAALCTIAMIAYPPSLLVFWAGMCLYALAFAQQFPALCKGVCLIDTGTPFAGRTDLMALPRNIRRTMVPARYFPDILKLPHKLVAANFNRSKRGEASVVDYFFSDSPHDQGLTRTTQWAYEVTRDIIAHSFDDTDRLVQDVSHWASDWGPMLRAVAQQKPMQFVHGQDNDMFVLGPIESFAKDHPLADVTPLPGGQLAAFENPETVATSLRALWDRAAR